MKKTSPTYSVRKQKDGDYEVTLHNQTITFSLKDVMLRMIDAQKHLNEVSAAYRLDKAVLQNIKDHHSDVINMFEKLPKVKRAALVNHIQIQETLVRSDAKVQDAKKVVNKLKKQLADIHAVIPKEDKKLTKSEQRRIDALKK